MTKTPASIKRRLDRVETNLCRGIAVFEHMLADVRLAQEELASLDQEMKASR